jgi:ribosome-binding protein aMBF1 (putative translation factor)
MAEAAKGRLEQLEEEFFPTPELRRKLEERNSAYTSMRRILIEIDQARETAGVSKADLARSIGVNPSVVRRLFTSPTTSPSLKVVCLLASALGLQITIGQAFPAAEDIPARMVESPARGRPCKLSRPAKERKSA